MAFFTWLQDTPFAHWVASDPSLLAYPTILTLHTVGMAIVVGTCVVMDLRLLGVAAASRGEGAGHSLVDPVDRRNGGRSSHGVFDIAPAEARAYRRFRCDRPRVGSVHRIHPQHAHVAAVSRRGRLVVAALRKPPF